jgi:predicted nuclease with RNAse H fold
MVCLPKNPTVRMSGLEEEPGGMELSRLIEAAKLSEHHRIAVVTTYFGHLATRGKAIDDHQKSVSTAA